MSHFRMEGDSFQDVADSITWSARSSDNGGIVRPSALAVLRSTTEQRTGAAEGVRGAEDGTRGSALFNDFPAVWAEPTMGRRTKKRLIRLLILEDNPSGAGGSRARAAAPPACAAPRP